MYPFVFSVWISINLAFSINAISTSVGEVLIINSLDTTYMFLPTMFNYSAASHNHLDY